MSFSGFSSFYLLENIGIYPSIYFLFTLIANRNCPTVGYCCLPLVSIKWTKFILCFLYNYNFMNIIFSASSKSASQIKTICQIYKYLQFPYCNMSNLFNHGISNYLNLDVIELYYVTLVNDVWARFRYRGKFGNK